MATFPAGTGKRIENMQSRQSQIESPSGQGIFDELLQTASEVIGELRQSPQKYNESPQSKRKPLSYPLVDPVVCAGCGICADACPNDAISINATVVINESLCTGCRKCFEVCPRGAITFVEEGPIMPSL